MNKLISRTTMTMTYPHESANWRISALLLLLEVGSDDNDILVFPVGFQNSTLDKKLKEM